MQGIIFILRPTSRNGINDWLQGKLRNVSCSIQERFTDHCKVQRASMVEGRLEKVKWSTVVVAMRLPWKKA